MLTPEEWVRQHFIQYIIREKGFPGGLIKLESSVHYHQRQGRYDVLCLGRDGNPLLLIECKAPDIKINQGTFDQIARYNTDLKVPYLAATNGLEHYFMRIDFEERKVLYLKELPDYQYITSQ